MRIHLIKKLAFAALMILSTSLLSACGFFDKDNTPVPRPLVSFTPEIQPRLLWSANAGSGVSGEYLKIGPAISDSTIFTSSTNGYVTAIDKISGHRQWQTNTGIAITTSPGVGSGLIVVGSKNGEVIALHQVNGSIRWKVTVPGEILAEPAVNTNVVIIKTTDGYIRALSRNDGHELWSYQQTEPSLILRGASAPRIRDNNIFVGFANGTLAKLSANTGLLIWAQSIAQPEGAFAIQRMIDIDADPIIFDHRLYAATYQGKIASLDWSTGQIIWSHDISSYTGMVADNQSIYISDAKSFVWSFSVNSGSVNWQQMNLEARNLTPPALMNDYVVVGDAQGYLHWLAKHDGHFAARMRVGTPLFAAPIVDQNILYVYTSKGKLLAYSLS